ncbi:Ketoreductase azaE [Colletotrichum orbiculare MAFF 240422]|uniref:Ketoreductase azaE n=1 Tax=Colletotrichum orbiculare (strain 104-T / ATCC 96160 / CBS 514.97 / LARS 414 / MAFF 240422) TaxID=1213857 RepID=N4V5F6_COLOR|nr:Ketoreductase azaE [Colletotrichum orbiculare MAFF 240422]
MTRVLVTGGTGFLAGHVINALLQRGHSVLATVRSEDKGAFSSIGNRNLEASSGFDTAGEEVLGMSWTSFEKTAVDSVTSLKDAS